MIISVNLAVLLQKQWRNWWNAVLIWSDLNCYAIWPLLKSSHNCLHSLLEGFTFITISMECHSFGLGRLLRFAMTWNGRPCAPWCTVVSMVNPRWRTMHMRKRSRKSILFTGKQSWRHYIIHPRAHTYKSCDPVASKRLQYVELSFIIVPH